MILFTAGYPFSGKSEFVKLLQKELDGKSVTVINPCSLRPPEYETMSDDDKINARIAAWEVALDELQTEITTEKDSTIIVFDTCAAKITPLLSKILSAKSNGHRVFYTFIMAKLIECKTRAGELWPAQKVIDGYGKDFSESMPRMRKLSDRFFFIKNMDDKGRIRLRSAARKISKIIISDEESRIRQSEPVRSPHNRAGQKDDTHTKAR